jgi:hypothetical protein
MGQAIAMRTDFTAGEGRRFAKQAKDGGQARPDINIGWIWTFGGHRVFPLSILRFSILQEIQVFI